MSHKRFSAGRARVKKVIWTVCEILLDGAMPPPSSLLSLLEEWEHVKLHRTLEKEGL